MFSKKNKILILGSTGMLGYNLEKVLKKNNIEYYKTSRKKQKGCIDFDVTKDNLNKLPKVQYFINCIGIINKLISKNNIVESIIINSVFPYKLAKFCKKKNIKLIHISTDCVYSGKKGKYTESDIHDPIDIYGKTKSLGEPTSCMTIRTSIIGEENKNDKSLVEWVKNKKNKKIDGYLNHKWNGLTAKHLSENLVKIIRNKMYVEKLVHIYSEKSVSKYSLIKLIDKRFKCNCKIKKKLHKNYVNRTLSSDNKYSKRLNILSIAKQIKLM